MMNMARNFCDEVLAEFAEANECKILAHT